MGFMLVVGFLFFLIHSPTVHGASLEVTNVYVEKEKLVEGWLYYYKRGETIDLIIEFNQNVSCSGDLDMNLNNPAHGPARTIKFPFTGMQNNRTAIFSYNVNNAPFSGRIMFPFYHGGGHTKIPCSNYSIPSSEMSERLNFFSGINAINIDLDPPRIIKADTASSKYGLGEEIRFQLQFNEPIIASDDSVLNLANGKVAEYMGPVSVANHSIVYSYIVQPGDNFEELDVTGIEGTIMDYAGNVWDYAYNIGTHGLIANNKSVFVDGIKPDIRGDCDYCNEFTQNPKQIITAIDNETGLAELSYEWSTSESIPSSFSGSIVFTSGQKEVSGEVLPPSNTANGTYYLHVRARDRANNVENKTFGPYKFDNTPPTVSVSPTHAEGKGGEVVAITASDVEGSGVQKIRYRWNQGPWEEHFGDGVDLNIPVVEGTHTLEVSAVDGTGNTSDIQTFGPYTVDNTPPQPGFVYIENNQPKQSHSVEVTLTGNRVEERGRLFFIWSSSSAKPSENNSDWKVVFNENFWNLPMTRTVDTPEGLNGNWYLHVKTEDDFGNVGVFTLGEDVPGGVSFLLDNQPPEIHFQPNGNNGIYAQREIVDLGIVDNISALEQLQIQYLLLEEGETPNDYGTNDWLTSSDRKVEIADRSGSIRVHVKVTDEAGNTGYATSEPFAVDHIPPTGGVTFSNEHGHTNQKQIEVKFDAVDDLTSIELRYAVADGEWSEWLSYGQYRSKVIDLEDAIDGEGIYPIHVQYQDAAENKSDIYTIELTYDTTAPTVRGITYNPMTYTNQPVTVTMSYDDNFSPSGIKTVQIEENGAHTLTVFDLAGNSTTWPVPIYNIDRILPSIQFQTNGTSKKQQSVSTIVTATDNISTPDKINMFYAWSMSNDPAAPPEEWIEMNSEDEIALDSVDGEWYLWVNAEDEAGNKRTSISSAFLLDNTKPEVTNVNFSPEYRTAMPVTAELVFSEPVYLVKPQQTNNLLTRHEITFQENGTVQYIFVDEAGNQSTYTVVVDWIDTSLPTATVSMSTDTWTNEPVDVTISTEGVPPRALREIRAPEDAELVSIKTIEGDILTEFEPNITVMEVVYRLHSNGIIHFAIEDLETGLENAGQAQVNFIDVEPPTGEIRFSRDTWTQEDVTATLTASDNSGIAPEVFSEGGGEVVFTDNGEHTFLFRDAAGNVTALVAKVDWIVRETPEPTITFDKSTWTTETVTATISFENETAPITITNHTSQSYTFENNGTFTFYYEDAAGNIGNSGPITVDWIDREKPTGTLEYSNRGWTNQDVTVTLHTSDNSGEEVTFLNEGGNQHTFTENGRFTFIFRDAAGNENSVEAVVDRIDKTPLEANVSYSITEPTNGVVRATVQPSKPGVQVINNNGNRVFDFDQNGTFTFEIIDRAGNTKSITAVVDNIVRETPQIEVVYSTTEPTNDNVIARVRATDPEQEIFVLNNFRREEFVFTENGTFTFIVRDLAGNQVEVEAVVGNIDKSTAAITLEYSETEPTQNNVIVTIQSDRELTVLNNNGSLAMTFTNNAIRWIHAMDEMGNEYWIEVLVDNIDRTPPNVQFLRGETLLIPLGQEVAPLEGLRVFDDIDGDLLSSVRVEHSINPNSVGEYVITYEVADRAGNELRFERPARVVSSDQLAVYVNGETSTEGIATVVRGYDIHLGQFGALGRVMRKWDHGFQLKGHFKRNGDWLDSDTITVDEFGYYTFLIQDQQRRYRLVQVYVLPE